MLEKAKILKHWSSGFLKKSWYKIQPVSYTSSILVCIVTFSGRGFILILATKNTHKHLQVILVECETKPNKKRLFQKMTTIQNNLSLQKRLFEKVNFLPLLVIPPFNLTKILCTKVRTFWEIWIINSLGKIKHKISAVHD